MKSIILAAGLGTRMRGICNETPKPLLPVGKNTLIDFTIKLSLSLSLEPIVILGFQNDHLKHHLERKWPNVQHITAIHEFKDLTISLKAAEQYVNEDFLWIGADTIYLDKRTITKLIRHNKNTKRFGLLYCNSNKFTPKIKIAKDNKVLHFDVTGRSRSSLSCPTIFVSSPELFNFITEGDNRGLINKVIANKWNVFGLEYPPSKVLEANTPEEYYAVHRKLFGKELLFNTQLANSTVDHSYIYGSEIKSSNIANSIVYGTRIIEEDISNKLIWKNHEDNLLLSAS